MKNGIILDKEKKVFPLIIAVLGLALGVAALVAQLNLVCVVCIAYCCIVSALTFIGVVAKKRVYAWFVAGYAAAGLGIMLYYIIFGADAGFGAFTTGLAGFASKDYPIFTGAGNFFTRLGGNILLALPSMLILVCLFLTAKSQKKKLTQSIVSLVLSVLLMGSTVSNVLTMNLRSKPNTARLWQGHDDYLNNMKKAPKDNPNVLFVMMDDLGWGDISLNGAIYDTPNIDSIGENGLQLENFYSSYSVCSPARFATLTGRYPYRGYADNVIYPTVDSTSVFAATRIFNSIEMGANADGMLGDEITIAEALQSAGYATGAFGKWHLGDYGEYLPTNQGFDYFYGSHVVNDMAPFYHVVEENGEYEIVRGTDELKDQSEATKWIDEEITQWITDVVEKDEQPFFAYYASPWPHAPIFAGDDFDGVSGMGTYVDCVTEFDTYLGKLFNTLDDLGVLEDTIIVFTSDNGPALQGSVGELRGGKYLAYEGGQKVPFLIRWDNNGGIFEAGGVRSQSATLVDMFPTILELCGITEDGKDEAYLPEDRIIDGESMLPLFKNDDVIHGEESPILYMKREDIKAIQYTVDTESVTSREEYAGYDYSILSESDTLSFKYFDRIQNDNSAFWDKYRTKWLHVLNDDGGENYNRTPVYPEIAAEMDARLKEIQRALATNRRGVK